MSKKKLDTQRAGVWEYFWCQDGVPSVVRLVDILNAEISNPAEHYGALRLSDVIDIRILENGTGLASEKPTLLRDSAIIQSCGKEGIKIVGDSPIFNHPEEAVTAQRKGNEYCPRDIQYYLERASGSFPLETGYVDLDDFSGGNLICKYVGKDLFKEYAGVLSARGMKRIEVQSNRSLSPPNSPYVKPLQILSITYGSVIKIDTEGAYEPRQFLIGRKFSTRD